MDYYLTFYTWDFIEMKTYQSKAICLDPKILFSTIPLFYKYILALNGEGEVYYQNFEIILFLKNSLLLKTKRKLLKILFEEIIILINRLKGFFLYLPLFTNIQIFSLNIILELF